MTTTETNPENKRKLLIKRESLHYLMNELNEKEMVPKTKRKTVWRWYGVYTHVQCMDQKDSDFAKKGDTVETRYQITGKVREDGSGQIYKAIDTKPKLAVAIKMEAVQENRPNVEGYILSKFQKFSHPIHWPSVTLSSCSYGERVSANYGAMQIIATTIIGRSIRITIQCLQAVEVLHQLGIMHRDINPSNFEPKHRLHARLWSQSLLPSKKGKLSRIHRKTLDFAETKIHS